MIGQNSKKQAVTIRRNENYIPIVYDGEIAPGCVFESTVFGIFGTLIIDQHFMDDMHKIANHVKDNYEELGFYDSMVSMTEKIGRYFYKAGVKGNHNEAYSSSLNVTKEGIVFGTPLSSLREKNVAQCSERSIASYLVLKELKDQGIIKFTPSLTVSHLNKGAHAFILMDRKGKEYPFSHLLLDTNNPLQMRIKDKKGVSLHLGLFSLTDEERENLALGVECNPTPTLTAVDEDMIDIGPTRTYGSIKLERKPR